MLLPRFLRDAVGCTVFGVHSFYRLCHYVGLAYAEFDIILRPAIWKMPSSPSSRWYAPWCLASIHLWTILTFVSMARSEKYRWKHHREQFEQQYYRDEWNSFQATFKTRLLLIKTSYFSFKCDASSSSIGDVRKALLGNCLCRLLCLQILGTSRRLDQSYHYWLTCAFYQPMCKRMLDILFWTENQHTKAVNTTKPSTS